MNENRSPMWCVVHDPATGQRWRIGVPNEVGSWQQTLGSGADDGIRIPLAAMPAQAVRLVASGRHLQVTALVPGLVRVRGECLGIGAARRIDGAFALGALSVTIGHDEDPDDED